MSPTEHLLAQTIDRFWETIPPLWNFVRSHLRTTATGSFEITVEQFQVLRYVRRRPNSMGDLAAAKHISRPAISQAVDVLVKKGLLSRIPSTTDRRVVELALTGEGDALLNSIFSENRKWMKKRMSQLSSKELETISQAMQALKKIWE